MLSDDDDDDDGDSPVIKRSKHEATSDLEASPLLSSIRSQDNASSFNAETKVNRLGHG